MNHFVRRGRTLSACAARRLAAMAKQWPKSGRAVMVALVETSWEDGYTGVIGAGFIWEVLVRWRRAEMEFPEGNFKPRAIPQHSSTSHHSQEGLSTSHHFPQQSSRQHSQYFAATLPPLTPRPEQNRVPHFHNFQAPPTICTYSGNETPKAWVSESANQQLSFHGKPQVSQSNYEHQTQALFAYSDHIDPRFIPEVARLSKVGPSHGQPLPPRAVPYKSSSRLHEEILPCSPPFTPENNPRYLTKHWGSSYPENRQITPPGEAQTRCRDLLQSQDCVKHPALSVPQAPLQPSSRRQVPLTPLPNESSAIFQDSASFYWQIQQIQVLTPNPLRNSSPWRVPGHHTKCAPRDWVNPLSRVVTLRWPRRGTERNFLMSLEDLKEKQQKLEKKFSYLRTPTGELDKVARDKWVQWLLNPWIVYNSPSQSAFQFLSRPALSARSPDINTDTKVGGPSNKATNDTFWPSCPLQIAFRRL